MALTSHSKNIWVPGAGLVPLHIRQAQKAIEEYDADLRLARDEENGGQWVVLLRGEGGQEYPVLGLGYELPNPEQIKARLYKADTRRRGREIVRDIMRAQERAQAAARYETHQAAGEVAEAMDAALHVMKRHPTPRIFVPGGKD